MKKYFLLSLLSLSITTGTNLIGMEQEKKDSKNLNELIYASLKFQYEHGLANPIISENLHLDMEYSYHYHQNRPKQEIPLHNLSLLYSFDNNKNAVLQHPLLLVDQFNKALINARLDKDQIEAIRSTLNAAHNNNVFENEDVD